jgi:uncharacterized protein (TIGR00730 family)
MKVFVGCSSYDDIDKKYFDTAKKVSNILIDHNCTLVVGGGDYGLMGSVYHQFLDNDKPVLGIATDYYKCDLDKMDCKKIYVKSTLDQMEAFMKESDIFLFLPGGYGTYNEIFYMMCEYINESHNKPIIIYNINGYYDEIDKILNKMKEEKFAKKFNFVKIVNNLDEFKSIMEEIC